ncbi:MAG: zinc-ribbon domain-containing protein [Candidatus Adiutrix sp.]|jgi:predicted Zn finger-like uncharacterized protein|nr:zinc-ribbon domain-containing protein [Candidatus Adiutrix sp.]
MIITCGQCQAKFKVAPEQIKETGSKVRCSNCRYVFTVYRPQRPVEAAAPAVDDFRESGPEQDDYYGPADAGRTGRVPDDYDDSPDDRPSDDPAALKERRDRRRRLYEDIENSADSGFDDDDQPEDDYGDDDFDDEQGGLPPLRRNRGRQSSAMMAEPEDEGYDDSEEYDDDEYERDDRPERVAAPQGDLGLGADPVEGDDAPEEGSGEDPFARLAAGYRGQKGSGRGGSRGKSKLLAGLAILAALLAVGIYFLTGPQDALITGDETPAATTTTAAGSEGAGGAGTDAPAPDAGTADPNGTLRIGFTEGQQGYFYRTNTEAGNILILTGQVRNNYSEPRSFVYLRGHLLSTDETTLADRFAYAGNLLSEEELKTLPMREIATRLLIKGGRDNVNVNIPPGTEVPFMMVFDNVPDGTDQYRIDAVSSEPAQQ